MNLSILATAFVASAAVLVGCTASGPAPTDALPTGSQPVTLDPADFSTTIDNPYWPMSPGTQWIYRETDGSGAEYTVIVTVTSETKKLANGIEARVVRDTLMLGDAIVEDTIDWYAQDSAGAIWYLGEQTAELENGEIVSTAGSFEAGVNGALPGVAVPAEPVVGMRYRQEYLKGEAEDAGMILALDELTEVPYGAFDGVLATRDTTPLEPDVVEYKFYAPGVGPVLTLGISGGGGREELLSVGQVDEGTATGPLGRP
jgi:hypothetical protein